LLYVFQVRKVFQLSGKIVLKSAYVERLVDLLVTAFVLLGLGHGCQYVQSELEHVGL
jgi:hypothetical protein